MNNLFRSDLKNVFAEENTNRTLKDILEVEYCKNSERFTSTLEYKKYIQEILIENKATI